MGGKGPISLPNALMSHPDMSIFGNEALRASTNRRTIGR